MVIIQFEKGALISHLFIAIEPFLCQYIDVKGIILWVTQKP